MGLAGRVVEARRWLCRDPPARYRSPLLALSAAVRVIAVQSDLDLGSGRLADCDASSRAGEAAVRFIGLAVCFEQSAAR